MANTKIINVQKGDSFEDVFEYFQGTEAEDVIMIFPRGTIFGKNERCLELIGKEAQAKGKTVSVMSSDPVIAKLASQNGLIILGESKPKATLVAKTYANDDDVAISNSEDEPSSLD